MSSTSERPTNEPTRTYDRASSVVFLKTDAPFGGLSNMAGGFPLHVQGTRIYTSEALYQACRFPHLPEVQRLIIGQASPMTAKMKSKPHRKDSRPDWDRVRVKVMRWCLRVKLVQNWAKFSELLLRTEDRPIVEESRRDDFWGAKLVNDRTLLGMNVLGRLLMELREAVKAQGLAGFQAVEPLEIPEFLFLGGPTGTVGAHELSARDVASTSTASAPDNEVSEATAFQGSLFDAPSAREGPAPAYVTSPTPESTRLSELKPYPAMKDSGVPWLGEVPEHWPVISLRAMLKARVGGSWGSDPDAGGQLARCVRGTDFNLTQLKATVTKAPVRSYPAHEVARRQLHHGDLVMATSGGSGELAVGSVVLFASSECALPTNFAAKLVPRDDAIPAYLVYLHYALNKAGVTQALTKKVTIANLDTDAYLLTHAPFPPLPEQAVIVRFLDYVDRRIRRYIRAKHKLIKLLEEQKQAIIHRAVTRGLDPNVRLKPSGVEWLGEVPEHWSVAELRRIVAKGRTITYGIVQPGEYVEGGRPMVRAQDYSFGWVPPATVYHVAAGVELPYRRSRLRTGDIVYTIVGQGSVGNVAVVPSSFAGANITQTTARISLDPELALPRFVAAVLAGPIGQTQLRRRLKGVGQPGINLGHLRLYQIPLPPIAEQRRVSEFINSIVGKHDHSADLAQREVNLLRELRTRLIADVVTGKLDVREAAARLPEETDSDTDAESHDDLCDGFDLGGDGECDETSGENVDEEIEA